MKRIIVFNVLVAIVTIIEFGPSAGMAQEKGRIVHDAEYYIL